MMCEYELILELLCTLFGQTLLRVGFWLFGLCVLVAGLHIVDRDHRAFSSGLPESYQG